MDVKEVTEGPGYEPIGDGKPVALKAIWGCRVKSITIKGISMDGEEVSVDLEIPSGLSVYDVMVAGEIESE